MPVRARSVLSTGLRIASQQVADLESCSELFSDLDANGLQLLTRAVYYRPSNEQKTAICLRRGAAAFTERGGTRIGICTDRFAHLTRWEAAAALIHEALHHAGMPEKPSVADALSSNEITELVRNRCRL